VDSPECLIAPLYRASETQAVVGVTVRGKGFFALRDAKELFSNKPKHADLGNWTVAMGTLDGARVDMLEGFEGPGKIRPVDKDDWSSSNSSVEFCAIDWPRENDTWIPFAPVNRFDFHALSLSPYAYDTAWERARETLLGVANDEWYDDEYYSIYEDYEEGPDEDEAERYSYDEFGDEGDFDFKSTYRKKRRRH